MAKIGLGINFSSKKAISPPPKIGKNDYHDISPRKVVMIAGISV
jgi:hypothetical protein